MPTTTDSATTYADNVAAMFFQRVAVTPEHESFRYLLDDRWVSATWRDTATTVQSIAAGLLALGIQPEDRVAIASSTRYEWVLADLAVMCAGAATTTVYPSTNAADTAYILADSGSRIVFAEDGTQLAKLSAHRHELPDIERIVVFDGEGDGDTVITLEDLVEMGRQYLSEDPQVVADEVAGIHADQLATLIYTSGTTGRPKGVRLTHQAWVHQGSAIASLGDLDERDLQLLWLPLAHAFGKVLLSAQLACGFATAIDGRVDKIIDNLGDVEPTFMAAAPRIFEKAYARIMTTRRGGGGWRDAVFDRAMTVGLDVSRRRRAARPIPWSLRLQHRVFDRLVFAKIRQVFGGRIRFFVSGSAPLNRDIAEWFHAAGLLILEGYGMTETAGGGFVNHFANHRLGTVGLPFVDTEVRIGADGEIQLAGPNVMAGYHHLPEATADAFTGDGWLRTGDCGALDGEGYLTITGRIKELFKTSGGKYIVPPAIEAKMTALCPYVSQFLVFGEARHFCVALLTLDEDALASWARRQGLSSMSHRDLIHQPQVYELIEGHIQQLNAGLNRWETIKKWAVLDDELSVESGDLTPSLKVKRTVVAQRHHDTLEAFYA